MTVLAFDKAFSFRWHDKDGRLHVDKSNLTRVQVAPYLGSEIPHWKTLGLDEDRIYYGLRPAEELGDPETVKSVIGIPIQLDHHFDHPGNPAMSTRVGSTGDSAEFDGVYLSNSLHIQNADACRRIKDGSMKQLSLAYYYEPDFKSSGEYRGQKYDFTMRKIRGQHLALVEEGRAGESCCVADSALKLTKEEKAMNEEKLPEKLGKDGESAVEQTEVKIADAMGKLANLLRGLHETNAEGDVEHTDSGKEEKIAEIADAFANLGASEEDVKTVKDSLESLARSKSEEGAEDEEESHEEAIEQVEDEGEVDAPDGEEERVEEESEEEDELDDYTRDALKTCGFDEESPEFKRAFAAGLKFGQGGKEAQDEEPEEVEQQDAVAAQDAAMRRFEEKMDAIEECKPIIGNVRRTAFDSAGSVYLHALKQLGVNVKGIKPHQAQAVYYGYSAGSKSVKKAGIAQDAKLKQEEVSDLFKGISVRVN